MALRPAVFDRQILSLDVAGFAQSLAERGHKRCRRRRRAGRPGVEDADHRHRLLLRARSERPCRHRAGEKNYEIASPHAVPLALTPSRDYGSTGPPRIGWAKGSFPPPTALFPAAAASGSCGAENEPALAGGARVTVGAQPTRR